MPEERLDRTSYLGLLALMIAAADAQNWSYPYWNIKQIDAALAALAQAPRDGTVPLAAPVGAPTATISATAGSIAGSITLEVGQTFVDEYGRETAVGPLDTVNTPASIADPIVAAALGTPTLGGASGYEGGLLEVWYSWTDGAGGETLPSPVDQVDVPYQAGGLLSEVTITLPSTPAVAGAAGANMYLRHRGGNTVLAYRIEVDSVDEITLTGAVADCYRSTPLVNSTGSVNAVDITGEAGPTGAVLTRFYVRNQGDAWASSDQRLKLSGVDEWDASTVTYPLVYTGATGELTAGFPPTVSQVKAIRPVDLNTEAIGTLPATLLPAEAVQEDELVVTTGEGVYSGYTVAAKTPADMTVSVATGMAMLAMGRVELLVAASRTIPVADPALDRIDIIALQPDGTVEGPTEDVVLKGSPGAVPSAPATPTGALKLAEVYVTHADTEIAAGDITDFRRVLLSVGDLADELRAEDADTAEDLSDHISDDEAHASKPGTMATVNLSCDAVDSQDFTIAAMPSCLVTELAAICTMTGTPDYDLYLFSDASRTVLQYQAGNGTGEGIDDASFSDRVPFEWFGGTTVYGRVTNYTANAISDLAITIKYRK